MRASPVSVRCSSRHGPEFPGGLAMGGLVGEVVQTVGVFADIEEFLRRPLVYCQVKILPNVGSSRFLSKKSRWGKGRYRDSLHAWGH